MKRSRGSMRRLFMQSLECRCVMDASGFEMGTEVFQEFDLESSTMFQSVSPESSDGTSTDVDKEGETVDQDSPKVMYFSMVDQELCDLPTIDVSESESSTGISTGNEQVDETIDPDAVMESRDWTSTGVVQEGETEDPVMVICNLPTIDLSETDVADGEVVLDDMVKRTVDETDAVDESSAIYETIFQTFDATSQDDSPLVISPASHQVSFHFDVDQSGGLSRLDAELLISYLSNFFRSENFSVFAESNSNDLLQMDVDGDAQLTPLDALIVINELNRSGNLEANVSTGASNSTLVASGDLRIRDVQDDLGDDAVPIEEIGSSVDGSTEELGKRLIAPMRMSYKSITLAKEDGTAFVLSVDDNGKVSAASDSQDLEVSIGEDQVISVDGESSGLAVVDFGGVLMLSSQVQVDGGFMFA